MQALSIQTEFPPSGHSNLEFSVLPSPSTFFLSNGPTFPSPTFEQYSLSHHHFQGLSNENESLPALSHSQSDSSWSVSAPSDRSPSPASSYPSTPNGSPLPEQIEIHHHEDKAAPIQFMSATGTKCEDVHHQVPSYESPSPFIASNFSSQHQFDCGSQMNFVAQLPLPPSGGQHGQYLPQYSHQNVHEQQQQRHVVELAPPPVYQNFAQQSLNLGSSVSQAPAVNYQQQQQHAQAPVAYSTGPLSNGNISYALPHPAPPPAAIETPHGTYYFVPNIVATSAPLALPSVSVNANNDTVQLPTPPPRAVSDEPMPAPPSNHAGYVQLPNGLTAGVAIAQASTPVRSSTGATATIQVGDQKIRLPVGQGKRGSTKRPAKKDQVKRFICPHPGCGRAFARNFNMQSHHKSHLGIREFTCPHCPKKFSRRHDRARHCSAVHDSHVDRDGNIAGTSATSGSPSAHSFDGEFDDEEDAFRVDYAD